MSPSESSGDVTIVPLDLWKHIAPSDRLTFGQRKQLIETLWAAAEACDRPFVRDVAQIATPDGANAMLALALDYERTWQIEGEFELSIGWLVLATPHSKRAWFMLGWFLIRRARMLERQIDCGELDETLVSTVELLDEKGRLWLASGADRFADIETIIGPLPTLLSVLRGRSGEQKERRRTSVSPRLFQASKQAAVTEPHMIRVLDPIPPALGDPHLEALIERFDRLTEPVATTPLPNVDQVVSRLRTEFPWAETAIAWIEADLQLAAYVGAPCFALRPVLLVGPPGGGKTRFVRRLAEIVDAGFATVAAAGSNDNRALFGTARGWSNACPALPLMLIESYSRANPMILVDEIDKTATNPSVGRILDTLLMLFERESAARWFDECLMTRGNLSAVSWICTANDVSRLGGPLRSRLAIVPFGVPRDEDFLTIVAGIRSDLALEYGCPPLALPELPNEVIEQLRVTFRNQKDVRVLRRLLAAAMAQATRHRPVTN